MLPAALILSALYAALIFYSLRGWSKIPLAVSANDNSKASVFITVVIPARDEAANIEHCLQALRQQTYPAGLFEVIVINDHSTDNTAALAAYWGAKVINLPEEVDNSHKKAAIELAVAQARGKLIVTTDADTIAHPQWLAILAACFEAWNPVFMAAPVGFYGERNALQRFQSLDMLGMMVLTGAGIQQGTLDLCNGANLAFAKNAFEEVKGYSGVSAQASGDDMFLMKKMRERFPGRIAFVKHPHAMVFTRPQPNMRAFIGQRLRWASKMGSFYQPATLLYTGAPFLLCWAILLSLVWIPLWGEVALAAVLIMFGVKLVADFALLGAAGSFFGRPELMRYFWLSQLYHIIYIAGIGLLSFFIKKYTWKGRVVR